jgi:polysaccharide pyruvyl transferase WcaK-like protein
MSKTQRPTGVTETVAVHTETAEKSADAGPMPGANQASESMPGPRVALLTPYNGGNFGDAAIQDAMIANLRLRLPSVQISGISLNSDNFLARHGTGAFPLCASNIPFYGMYNPWEAKHLDSKDGHPAREFAAPKRIARKLLRKIPLARRLGKKLQTYFATIRGEVRHILEGYRFLRSHKLLIVSGGGQLDEEWGGPWGHPYCLFKWAVIAKCARVSFVIVSVGAGKTFSLLSRIFLAVALRLACYRSFRDVNSRDIAAKWLSCAANDSVVPDLAFSLPSSVLPPAAGVRSLALGRPIVALSPIAYAKPGRWPLQDQVLYDRYKRQLAQVVAQLAARGYFLVVVWSSAGDDEQVASEILACLDEETRESVGRQIHVPTLTNWKELAALLADVDCLIASRLHSTILGCMTKTPTLAISFDPKVDWVMQDLGQTPYLLQINDFETADVLQGLDSLLLHREKVLSRFLSYQEEISPLLCQQYDALANLVAGSRKEAN